MVHLTDGGRSVVLAVTTGAPEVRAFTNALRANEVAGVVAATEMPVPDGGSDALAPVALIAEGASGYIGRPGIEGSRPDRSAWAPRFGEPTIEATDTTLTTIATDSAAGLRLTTSLRLTEHGLLFAQATLTNDDATDYHLDALRLCMLVPDTNSEILAFTGRWSNEFLPERIAWDSGTISVDNRRGRTSPDRMPTAFVGTSGFSEERGEVMAVHVAWSGNTALRFDALTDGRRVLQAGELLLPGEIVLAPGESYRTPEVVFAVSTSGLNGISDQFHEHFRSRPNHPQSPRPIHLNTWEAVYFDHDLTTLKQLADRAAGVGIERWVLDDGWFHARRNDRAGLGDWWIDPDVWPDGLGPIIDHVTGLGMEFGLWFEPEMVNPDSDLYRNHPEWVLTEPNYDPLLARNQLVLDLTQPQVAEYLYEKISTVLGAYDIAYVKWDMNRDLVHPTHEGHAAVNSQTHALYELLRRLTSAFPEIEFESCSSGGARIDARILDHTKRFWTSDCNDALDRQRIQRGFSYLFPPELMGAHIGPPTSHTTGRTHRLDFRAATAIFGHFGVEWNLLDCTDDELAQVAQVIEVHKRFRELLHHGQVRRFDHPDPAALAHAVVAPDGSESLACLAQIETSRCLPMARLRWSDLTPDATYRIEVVGLPTVTLGKAKQQPAWIRDGIELSGAALSMIGLQPPVLHPESALLIYASRV